MQSITIIISMAIIKKTLITQYFRTSSRILFLLQNGPIPACLDLHLNHDNRTFATVWPSFGALHCVEGLVLALFQHLITLQKPLGTTYKGRVPQDVEIINYDMHAVEYVRSGQIAFLKQFGARCLVAQEARAIP